MKFTARTAINNISRRFAGRCAQIHGAHSDPYLTAFAGNDPFFFTGYFLRSICKACTIAGSINSVSLRGAINAFRMYVSRVQYIPARCAGRFNKLILLRINAAQRAYLAVILEVISPANAVCKCARANIGRFNRSIVNAVGCIGIII